MNTQIEVLSWLEIPRYDMRAPGSRRRQMTCDVDRTNKHICLELKELVPSLLIVTKVPKVWILNPKSEIVWNLKSKIGLRSKIQNLKSEIKSEIWILISNIWNLNPKSEIKNLKNQNQLKFQQLLCTCVLKYKI